MVSLLPASFTELMLTQPAESYLKERQTTAKYERDDFDSLSSKFLSKLVIRAN